MTVADIMTRETDGSPFFPLSPREVRQIREQAETVRRMLKDTSQKSDQAA